MIANRRFPESGSAGFALPSAIFLLVVLSALGAFLLTFSSGQQMSSAADINGSRAYWAARAGIEWGAAKIKAAGACPASPSSFNVEGFTVAVSCASNSYKEGADPRTIYMLTSQASAGGGVGGLAYVERQMTALVEY